MTTAARAETWATPPGFSRYAVSDDGRVRDALTGRERAAARNRYGRWQISHLVTDDGRAVTREVHVLVAAAHLGPRPDGHEVCHGSGKPLCRCHGRPVKDCNDARNLRYDTPDANRADRWGRRSRWSKAWRAGWRAARAEWRR